MPTRVGFLLGSKKHFPSKHDIYPGGQTGLAAENIMDETVSRCQGWRPSETMEEVEAM